MSHSCESLCDKIVDDLIRVFKSDITLKEFEIVPTATSAEKNSSPVLKGGQSLGLKSWAVRHVLPYANRKILELNTKKDHESLVPYLLAVNLLLPDMPTCWNRRKELIQSRIMTAEDDIRLTGMALTRNPKCNDALSHRRWLIVEKHVSGDATVQLQEELELTILLADRYASNYHAWTHREWAMQYFLPTTKKDGTVLPLLSVSKQDLCHIFTSTHLPVYLADLDCNLKFISSHVSDHSGFHYRKFLLTQICYLLQNGCTNNGRNANSNNDSLSLLFYSNVKPHIVTFFNCNDDSTLMDYLSGLEYQLRLFDVMIAIFISELRSNSSMSSLYPDHEALWYHRRYLIYSFESLLIELKNFCNNNYKSDNVHCNRSNGLSLRKEIAKYCDLISIFAATLLNGEELFMKSSSSSICLVNHSRWLRHVCGLNKLLK